MTILRQAMNRLLNGPDAVPSTLTLTTDLSVDELSALLRKWEPWRHEICFSNGLKTSQFRTAQPWTDQPLGKLQIIARHLPLESLRGGRGLDIGCNAGYNSVFLAQSLGMHMTGIDVVERHIEVSTFLASLAPGARAEFIRHDATTFSRPGEFDLVLHFGTLYHLPNPLLSIENTARNLKSGGYLALETNAYTGSEPAACRWIRGVNNDRSNFWALSKPVIEEVLGMYGLRDIRLLAEIELKKQAWAAGLGLTRVLYLARK